MSDRPPVPSAVPPVPSAVLRDTTAPRAEGILVVDKPVGPTSFDVVHKLRKSLNTREIGHCGTLDPLASGVVVVCVGRYCKLVRFLTSDDKRYVARVTFGFSTPSFDLETEADAHGDPGVVDEARLRAVLASMKGVLQQVPPVHSAVQKDGERLYAKARRGEVVVVEPRTVTVHALTLRAWDPPHATIDVDVGKGFYVRSLARDLGALLGCPSHLSALRRHQSGAYSLDDAVGLDVARDPLLAPERLLKGASAIRGMERVELDAAAVDDLRHGRRPATTLVGTNLLGCAGDDIVAVVDVVEGRLHSVRGF